MTEPTYEELMKLFTVAIDLQDIGGARASSLRSLYEARISKFNWTGIREQQLRITLDGYLEQMGFKKPITTEIEEA